MKPWNINKNYKSTEFPDQSAHINRALILVVYTLSRWERTRARWKKLFQRTEQFDYRCNRIGRWLTVSIEPFHRKNALAIIKTVTRACEARRGASVFRFGKCNSAFLHRLIVLGMLDYLHAHVSINLRHCRDACASSRCQYAINWSARACGRRLIYTRETMRKN